MLLRTTNCCLLTELPDSNCFLLTFLNILFCKNLKINCCEGGGNNAKLCQAATNELFGFLWTREKNENPVVGEWDLLAVFSFMPEEQWFLTNCSKRLCPPFHCYTWNTFYERPGQTFNVAAWPKRRIETEGKARVVASVWEGRICSVPCRARCFV